MPQSAREPVAAGRHDPDGRARTDRPGRPGDDDPARRTGAVLAPRRRRPVRWARCGTTWGRRWRGVARRRPRRRAGGLNLVETDPAPRGRRRRAARVSPAARRERAGHVVGVTGPPGPASRRCSPRSSTDGAPAGGPSPCSRSTPPPSARGGSLLGDRARIDLDPGPWRLHPLDGRRRAAGRPRAGDPRRRAGPGAAFDIVVIETVGVGQSETDVADAADTVAVIVQPGSGDALQFLKCGIMEIPTSWWSRSPTSADRPARAPDLHARCAPSATGPRRSSPSPRAARTGSTSSSTPSDAHRAAADVPTHRRDARRQHRDRRLPPQQYVDESKNSDKARRIAGDRRHHRRGGRHCWRH